MGGGWWAVGVGDVALLLLLSGLVVGVGDVALLMLSSLLSGLVVGIDDMAPLPYCRHSLSLPSVVPHWQLPAPMTHPMSSGLQG